MNGFGLVDDVIGEPVGGAHSDPEKTAAILKEYLIKSINELSGIEPATRVTQRIAKFAKMGFYDEVGTD
jgi:acetyl-CoA carboxylase carboxyl transferase subunit alpha